MGCIVNGDAEAVRPLMERYQGSLSALLRRALADSPDVDDVFQEVWIRVVRSAHRYDPSQRFFSWIYRIAVNEALDVSNGRKRTEPVADTLPSERIGPEGNAQNDEMDGQMQDAMMAIPVDYRTLIVLKHVQDCSYEEIAAILACPVKTVKSRLFTARQALREVLVARGFQ